VETDSFREQLQSALTPAYTIQRELTGGGMSRVFVALEHSLGRTVVVKVLKPELGAGVNRERFRREIMLAAQLQHPHIVPVLNAGEHGDLLWYTMPFVEGVSLRDSLAHTGKFSARTVTRVLHDVLDALAYAHRRGVVHRDIKPGNILHHGSHSLVTDFGVAKALSAALPHSGTTSVGIAIGTPAYMAPEQLAADPSADHRMDLYAVGLLAYELLTGVQPFSGSSPQATMAAQLTRMPTPLEECCPGVPPQLASLIMRLLAKHPDDRPPTAAAALAELEAFTTPTGAPATEISLGSAASGGPATPAPSGPASTVSTQPRRRRWVLLATAAVVAVIAAGIALAKMGGGSSPSVTSPPAPPTTTAARHDSLPTTAPVHLTHEDSLRIAEAVRKQMTKARTAIALPGGSRRDFDSLQQTLIKAFTDSAFLDAQSAIAAAPEIAGIARAAIAESAIARARTRLRRAEQLGALPMPPSAPRTGEGPAARPARRQPTPPPRAPIFARPRRVAILPVRDASPRGVLASTAQALDDSLRKALVDAGYTPASSDELVRLMGQSDLNAQRRIADAMGIGAIVMTIVSTHADEVQAQSIVLDVWRNYPFSDRTAADLDKQQEALGVVRNVTRALDHVSWRTRGDPKRVVIFDIENQTGNESVNAMAKQLTDSLRMAVRRRFGAEVVTDSQVTATKDIMERRAVGTRLGAGAIMAGTLYRARGDSVSLRMSTRDLSEDRTFPNVDVRGSRSELLSGFSAYVDRLLADLAQVNWGPKASQP